MKNSLSKKWLILFVCAFAAMALLVCAVVFIIDPFFQFRARDNRYFLNTSYVNAGLVKNYDYDTVIIGSCMVENYDIEKFNEAFGVNALKIGLGGIGPDGIVDYIRLANKTGRAKNYFINIDIAGFARGAAGEDIEDGLPEELDMTEYEYLLKDDPVSRLKYAFNYEAWFRFMPVDLGLGAYSAVKGGLGGGKLGRRASIAHNGEWSDDCVFGEEEVLKNRAEKEVERTVLTGEDAAELLRFMLERIDEYTAGIDFSAGNYTFIFPPYSYLYWEDARQYNRFDAYQQAKEHLIEKLKEMGAEVYDFQFADVTNDLSYYMGTTHYSKYMNDYMTECMASGEYRR